MNAASSAQTSNGWANNFAETHKDCYVGPTPLSEDYWATKQGVKFRRNAENGRSLRIEYGFLPKMNPSVEIDEQGVPLKKET